MKFKTIIAGKLEFLTLRSFNKALQMYEHKTEVLYKHQLFFKAEDIFDEEQVAVIVPRFVKEPVDRKWWKNSIGALAYLAEFAGAGNISGWLLDSGKILDHRSIEPTSDKMVVQAFLKGREILEAGNMDEAMDALNRAINKFERHALAYERRGFVNYKLGNYPDAIYDYTKSIKIHPGHAAPYYGRAIVHIKQGNFEQAIPDLDAATKTCIALQPLYWRSRRIKGDCHMELKQYEKAAYEYRLFTMRKFAADDPNHKALKVTLFEYGKALLAIGKSSLAVDAFKKSAAIESDTKPYSDAEWKDYLSKAKESAA